MPRSLESFLAESGPGLQVGSCVECIEGQFLVSVHQGLQLRYFQFAFRTIEVIEEEQAQFPAPEILQTGFRQKWSLGPEQRCPVEISKIPYVRHGAVRK